MAQAVVVDKCDLCESEENVDYFCLNCDEILCSNCKLIHSRNKKLKNDKIILLSQARRDNIVHKSTTVFCSEHSTVEITLFCLKCDHLICTQCCAEKHKEHTLTTPDAIRDSKAEQLNKIIKTLQEKKSIYENAFDIEGQVHSRFSKSIDHIRKEITDQKTKIIEELNTVCDEQFSELSKIQQNEDKRYSDSCNLIQAQNHTVTSAIQTAQNSIASDNTALIIQATTDTKHTLNGLEDPTMPPPTTATYQPGDRSRPTIRHVQGKVNIEQGAREQQQHDVNKHRDRKSTRLNSSHAISRMPSSA